MKADDYFSQLDTVTDMKKIIEPLQWDLANTLEFIGCPTAEDLKKGEEFGKEFAGQVKQENN